MAKLGTAFVDIRPDFSVFDRLVSRKLSSSFKTEGEQAGRAFSGGLTRTFKIPKVDVPTPDVPKVRAPKVEVPKVEVPKVEIPKIDLSDLGRAQAQLAGAEANVQRLKTRLEALGQETPRVEVKVAIAKAIADLDRAEAKVKELSAERVDIKVDVDRSTFASVTAAAQGLLAAVGGSGGSGLTGATTRISAGFLSFGSVVGPLAALLGALAVTVGVSLVGAFAALVASLAAAAAGVAALGVAFAAVLGPAVGLAVAVGLRLAKVFEALKAQDSAVDEMGRKSAAGSAAAAAASEQQASAARALTEANRQLGLATTSAYREMADAAERASDAIRGIERAQISLERAKLGTEQARLDLAKFREEAGATDRAFSAVFSKFTDVAVDTSGLRKAIASANQVTGGGLDESQELELRQKILDVRDARLREKEATDGVSDSQREATRAQQDNNKFKREGIKASEQYRGALRSVEAATLAVAAAQRQGDGGTAQEKALQLTGRLSKAENTLLGSLKRVRTELRGAFGPATDAVIGGMNRALLRTPQLINPLRGAFRRLGEAVGGSFDTISKDLIRPETVSSLRRFTDAAARLTGPITDGLLSLLHIFLDIANAALPHLVSGTRKVAVQLKEWSVGTSNSKKMSKSVGTLVGHLKTWLGVGAALGDVFLAFLESAAGPGQSLAESIKDVAERTARWLRSKEGRAEMAQFFKDAIAFAKDFVEFMAELIKATVKFGQEGARIFKRVADSVGGADNLAKGLFLTLGTLGGLKLAKSLINGIRDVRDGLRAARKAATLLHARLFTTGAADASTGLVGKAKVALSAIGSALASTTKTVLAAGRRVAHRLIAIFAAEGALAGAAAGNAAAGTSGLGKASIKEKTAAAGRRLGKAFGVAMVAGVVAGLVGLASAINSGVTDALGLKGGAQKFADDRNNNPLSKALKDLTDKLKDLLPFASGGMVPGSGWRDTVPAVLTPGEHVTRKAIVSRFGPTVFADINAGRLDPRVGYQPGQARALSVTAAPGPRMATGGLVGRPAATTQRPNMTVHNNITVPGGGPPDPVALGVQSARVIESRFGGEVGQE